MRMRGIFIKIPRVEIRLQGKELSDILQITSQMLKHCACCAVARGSLFRKTCASPVASGFNPTIELNGGFRCVRAVAP